jgi:type II secretory pathway predicted ATPase ExeA
MYNSFFSLRESPFNVNVDPRFFIPTQQTGQALQRIAYGIQNRRGLILLTGEVGTGKTMLINQLLDWLRQMGTPTAFVFNSNLGEGDLFNLMACDFGIAIEPNDRTNLPIRFNRWLFECYRAGVSPVLIVDEAQGLSFERLEEIRLLLNIETPSDKMLQIVFAGQPELEVNLNRPQGRQLRQRIAVRCKIGSLTLEQTHDYIERRLRIAGAGGESIFQSQAMDAVYFYARGIPRVINLICEHSLINAYVEQLRPVPARVVEEVAGEFQLTSSPSTTSPESIQSTFGWLPTPGAAPKQRETQRAHAAVAGVSSYFPKVSPKNPPAPALSDLQAHSATPDISEPSPLTHVSFAPATASAPTEQPKHWPVVLPAPAPPAQNVSRAPRTPASSPSAHASTSPEAHRSNAEIRSVEKSRRQRHWVSSSPHTGQKFRQWWLITLSRLRRSATPTPEVHQRPAYRHWKNVHQKPGRVPFLLHRDWLTQLDRYVSIILQSMRQIRTAIFRWLQQPLSSAHRR